MLPAPEHVAQLLEHATHVPEAVSKNWVLEHVETHVAEGVRTGREGGHERQVSKEGPQVAQSGWHGRQVEVELEGAKNPTGQEGPATQFPLRESWEGDEQRVQ